MKKLLLMLLILFGTSAFAQTGARYDGALIDQNGKPIVGANVRICTTPASGQPCTPLANVFSDVNLAFPISNPVTTDFLGNFFFYVAPSTYELEFSGAGLLTKQVPDVTIAIPGGGGGGGNPGSPNLSLQFNNGGVFSGVVNSSYNSGTGALTIPLIGNAAIKPGASDAVQFVSVNGNDANDGFSYGTAKLTAYTAICSLPGGNCATQTAGIGTVFVGPLSTYGGPISHQGMWLAGAGDPNNASLPTGWLHSAGGITIIGYGAQPGSAANGHAPKTEVLWGGQSNLLPSFWFSGLSLGIHLQNVFSPFTPAKIGIDSNNSRNGTGGTSGVWLDNFGQNLGNGLLGEGPGIDIGSNTFWIWISDSVVSGDIAEDYNLAASPTGLVRSGSVVTATTTSTNDVAVGDIVTVSNPNDTSFNGSFTVTGVSGSPQTVVTWTQNVANATSGGGALFPDKAFGVSINPGSGSGSGLIFIHDTNLNVGGIRLRPGANGGGLYAKDLSLEGNPIGPTPPVILVTSPTLANNVRVDGVETSDIMNSVTTPAVRVDYPIGGGPIGPFSDTVRVSRVQGQNVNVQGPMIVDGQYANNLQSEQVGLLQQGETGTARNRLYGQNDSARRGFSPVVPRFANIALQSTSWTLSHPANAGAALTPGVAAPDGTVGAVTGSQTGGTQNAVQYFNAAHTINVGDYFITGAWSQSNNLQGAGGGAVITLTTGSGNALQAYQQGVPYIGDGEWEWSFSVAKVVQTGTANPIVNASVQFTTAAPQTVYSPVLIYIPAGTVSDNEAYEIAYNLQGYNPSCAVGVVCGLPVVAGPGLSDQYANAAANGFASAAGISGLFNGIDVLPNPTVQTIAESQRVCGPSPSNDATCYGAKARFNLQTTTATGSATTLTVASAIDFAIGDVLDVGAGGASTTIVSPPGAPTVTSPWQTGSGTIHAQCVAVDANLGLNPGTVATFTGAPTQTQQNLAPSATTRSSNTITVTVTNTYVASSFSHPTIAILSGYVPIDLNGEYALATANGTTVTMNTGIWVATTETASTIGTITVYPYVDINCPVFLPTDPTTQYAVYDDISGSMHFVGMTLPNVQTEVKDWGTTIEPVSGIIPPSFIPVAPPVNPVNQVYQGKITNIAGTTFTVTPALTNTVTTQSVMHDDGPAILAAAQNARLTNGGAVMLPPNFKSTALGFYQVNFPFTFPLEVHLEIGGALFVNSTITMGVGDTVEGISGATNQVFPQFAFRTTAEVSGTGSPMFLFTGTGNTYANLTTILKSNAQNGVVFSSSQAVQSSLTTLRDDNFTDQGGTLGSVDQAVVLQGGQTGINIENVQFTMGGYTSGPGKLGPPVGGLVFRSEPVCTGCDNGIPNFIKMYGINSCATRCIMWDNSNQGQEDEANFRFSVQEYQNGTTPGVMWYGNSFAADIHLDSFLMDSSQASVLGNWSFQVRDIWLDHPTTSGGASLVTGYPIEGLHSDSFVSTTLGQNFDVIWNQVNTSRMGPANLSTPDTTTITHQYAPIALLEPGVGQSNIPIFVKYPAPVITVSTIVGTWPAGNYSITRAVVGPNGGTSRPSASVLITLNGSQGIQVTCTNCPVTGAYGYFDYNFSNALSTTAVTSNLTTYSTLVVGHTRAQGDGSGYPLLDATGFYTNQTSAGQLNMGSPIATPNWAGRIALTGGTKAVTFTIPYVGALNAPICIAQDETTITNTVTAIATDTTLTLTGTGTDTVKYICVGNPN